jgi:hypothetical protein
VGRKSTILIKNEIKLKEIDVFNKINTLTSLIYNSSVLLDKPLNLKWKLLNMYLYFSEKLVELDSLIVHTYIILAIST